MHVATVCLCLEAIVVVVLCLAIVVVFVVYFRPES